MTSKIRVKVEDDARIWKFLIEPEWTKIKHLGKYLKEIFNLEEIYLLDDDGFLHPNSNISYLYCMSKNNEILTIRSALNNKCESSIHKSSPKRKKPKHPECDRNKNNDLASDRHKAASILKCEPKSENWNSINSLTDRLTSFSSLIMSSTSTGMNSFNKDSDLNNTYANENDESIYKVLKKRKRKKKVTKSSSPEKVEIFGLKRKISEISSLKENTQMQQEKFLNMPKPYKEGTNTNHIHFNDSGEAMTKNPTSQRKTKIVFISYLDSQNFNKPRDVKPITVKLNDQDSTEKITQCSNDSQTVECNALNPCDNAKKSTTQMIGPQISAEFLNHKLEKWDDFPNYDANNISDKIEPEKNHLNKPEQSKIIVISNEIITNGIQNALDQ